MHILHWLGDSERSNSNTKFSKFWSQRVLSSLWHEHMPQYTICSGSVAWGLIWKCDIPHSYPSPWGKSKHTGWSVHINSAGNIVQSQQTPCAVKSILIHGTPFQGFPDGEYSEMVGHSLLLVGWGGVLGLGSLPLATQADFDCRRHRVELNS